MNNAIVTPDSFMVRCSSCGAEIPPPDTGIGRSCWMRSEMNRVVNCPVCEAENAVNMAEEDTES